MRSAEALCLSACCLGLTVAGQVAGLDLRLISGGSLRNAKVVSTRGTKVTVKTWNAETGNTGIAIHDISSFTLTSRNDILRAAKTTIEDMELEQAELDREHEARLVQQPYVQADRRSDRLAAVTKKAGTEFRTAYQEWIGLMGQCTTVGAFVQTEPRRAETRSTTTASLAVSAADDDPEADLLRSAVDRQVDQVRVVRYAASSAGGGVRYYRDGAMRVLSTLRRSLRASQPPSAASAARSCLLVAWENRSSIFWQSLARTAPARVPMAGSAATARRLSSPLACW